MVLNMTMLTSTLPSWNFELEVIGCEGLNVPYHFEGNNFKGRVVASVVTVLHPRQPLKPVVRIVNCKATQIHLDNAIENLCLSIILCVINRAESQFSSIQP